jgi:hypothetical protein
MKGLRSSPLNRYLFAGQSKIANSRVFLYGLTSINFGFAITSPKPLGEAPLLLTRLIARSLERFYKAGIRLIA